jgi:hypothetical protein
MPVMMDAQLRAACFGIAAFGGGTAFLSILFTPVRLILLPATILVAGAAMLLFLRMLFSRTYRQGIDAAHREMQGSDPWPGRPKAFLDAEWGLFGSRAGSPALLWLRAILVVGILPMGLLQNVIGMDVVWLWAAGGFVAMELSLMQVALSQLR